MRKDCVQSSEAERKGLQERMEAVLGKEFVEKVQKKEESSRVVILRQFYQTLKQRQDEVKVGVGVCGCSHRVQEFFSMVQSDASSDVVCIQVNDLYFWITARDCSLGLFKQLETKPELADILEKVQSTEPSDADDDKIVAILRELLSLYSRKEEEVKCVCPHGKTDPFCRFWAFH